jgi:hypothetical protein
MDFSLLPLAQAVAETAPRLSTFDRILASMPWFAWIAIVAIVCGSFSEIVKAALRHNERMAMIRMGLNPDATPTESPGANGKPSYPEVAEL